MPSPTVPRSKSAPRISGTPQSPSSHSDAPSRRTSRSEFSPRTWPKKVGDFIARKTGSSSSSRKSNLTEESLEEFNRLNEILEGKRYFQRSPYYKGLTDSSLVINRERQSLLSPDRESHASSFFSSSSKTSFVNRMQEWGSSYFTSKENKKISRSQSRTSSSNKRKTSRDSLASTPSLPSAPSSSSTRRKAKAATVARDRTTKTAKESGYEGKEVSSSTNKKDVAIDILNKGKPLRERVSQPPMPAPTPPHSGQQMPVPRPRTRPQPPQTSAQTHQREEQTNLSLQPPKTSATSPVEKAVQEKETNKYMWADKYRPSTLKDFLCNRSKALELQAMAKSENCSHFIFEGHPGVGKRTMIWAFLSEAFGEDRVQAREESKKFILKGESVGSINVNMMKSSKHVEINLSELRGYEKHVIVELIKEKSNKSSNKSLQCNLDNCRAIILYDVDKLPTEAIIYIKWVLEHYKGCNKLFFCCTDASKIQPLTSLCTLVQLLRPSTKEITDVLEFIAQKEEIKLPHQLAVKIARSSKNNLRQAIRSFEATWHFSSVLKEDQEILTGWEDDIANIARNIIQEQSPKQLYDIRGKLQNLIEHNVSPEFIFETLLKELKNNSGEQLQKQIDDLYEKFNKYDGCEKSYAAAPSRQEEMGKRLEDPVRKTLQQFMRIEEFIAKFMSWYKGLVVKNKEVQTNAL
ncbi:hypothetical protein ACH5RR_000556 [Cinchona calisaya]|uniref:Replication factor C subunit 3 n=1 Tax=Cinchona calisaya TaxID=153742 RepID=A0ABD3B0Y2_9GENT